MNDLKTTKIVDASKYLGEKWQKMSEQEKSIYQKMSDKDKIRHEN